MLLSAEEIQGRVNELVTKLGIPGCKLYVCFSSPGDGTPHITFDNNKYNYVVSERGFEFSRRTTSSLEELLYWIMSGFVSKLAFQYELKNRIEGKDGRKIAFPMIIDLMGKIDPLWRLRAKKKINSILITAPYDDT